MVLGPRLRTLALVGALLPSTSSASASAPQQVGVQRRRAAVLVEDDEALARRIAAEFEFLGFEAVLVEADPPADQPALEALARDRDASLAVFVVECDGEIELRLADRTSGAAVVRRFEIGDGDATRTVAVRVVELLRASLLELAFAPAPTPAPAPEPAPAPQPRPPAPPDPLRYGVTLGVAAVGAGGGLGAAAQVRATFRWMPHPHVGWIVGGAAPLSSARVRADEGQADVRIGWATSGVRVALRRDTAIVRPELSLAAGVIALGMVGSAHAPYTSGRDVVVTGLAEMTAGLEFAVTRHLRLRLVGAVGSCFTRPEVRFAGRTVASWCLPYGLGEAGLGVAW